MHEYISNEKVLELKLLLRDALIQDWLYDDMKKWTWWLTFALTFVPLMIWWKVVDRKRLTEIIIFGLLVNITGSLLDVLGSDLALWAYPDTLLPTTSYLIPFHYVIMPVTYMLAYQYFPGWQQFIAAMVILSGLFSFIAEPALVSLNLYQLLDWQYVYSFPSYILIGIFLRWVTKFFVARQI